MKRDAVLMTAVHTFSARGFYATSLDKFAATLQISKPTIYHYLGNKEQVLLKCVARVSRCCRQPRNWLFE